MGQTIIEAARRDRGDRLVERLGAQSFHPVHCAVRGLEDRLFDPSVRPVALEIIRHRLARFEPPDAVTESAGCGLEQDGLVRNLAAAGLGDFGAGCPHTAASH
ncbi:MAG TPA: hypothetical protein VJ960_04065 [Oceanipulchritudo sp.]|nr:hypothetical protein [Oceanipulchritudo sp.]